MQKVSRLVNVSRRWMSNESRCVVYNELDDGIRSIELNEPSTRNALSFKMVEQLQQFTLHINQDPLARVLILKSHTPHIFCAGANLKERNHMDQFTTEHYVATLRNTFHAFKNISVPTIGCIDGYALGGGLELGMSCDMLIASEKSVLGLVETGLGIIPGAGGTQNLSRLVGVNKAKELIYTGRTISGQEALDIGLVNYCEQDYQAVDNRALTLATSIVTKGPVAIRMAKQAIVLGAELDFHSALQVERLAYRGVVYTNDRKEGLLAFQQKRKPQYKGN